MGTFPDQHGPSPWFYRVILLLLLVLRPMTSGLLAVMSMVQSDPEPGLFSFAPGDGNTVLRFTARYSVPYFVKESFHSDYQGSLHGLEMEIELVYLNAIIEVCDYERAQNKLKMEQGAKAEELSTTFCDRADAYKARYNS